MDTQSVVPNHTPVVRKQAIQRKTGKLDTKVMDMMLSTMITQLEKTGLYKEEQGMIADYEQIQYALDAVYKFLYDQQNAHISSQDASVFTAYLVEKMKALKAVVGKINKA